MNKMEKPRAVPNSIDDTLKLLSAAN